MAPPSGTQKSRKAPKSVIPKERRDQANLLYETCLSHPDTALWTQDDLGKLDLPMGNDLSILLECINILLGQRLFKQLARNGQACFKLATREEAAKYSGLDTDETVVYNYIESVGRDGAWIKSIQTYSNLHISVVNKCLKSLESKSLIKRILNAKNPLKKVYLLFHLQPAEDVTGGSFYTDGTLDEEFIHQLCLWIENYVLRKSWYIEVPKSSKKKIKYKTTTEEAESTRAEVLQDHSKDGGRLLPMPPGYTGYPTLSEITRAINEFQISQVALKEAEVERLLDLLCWDGKLMKVLNGRFYKSVRASIQRENGAIANGLAESPCGRCPVFDLCEDGGPVNSRTCPYFKDWLGLNF